jgi:hypothetical protein
MGIGCRTTAEQELKIRKSIEERLEGGREGQGGEKDWVRDRKEQKGTGDGGKGERGKRGCRNGVRDKGGRGTREAGRGKDDGRGGGGF